MSQNQHLDAAWQYHSGTKHSYLSLRTDQHSLDWENKPLLFKIYPTLEVTRLPKDFRETGVAALSAIAETNTAVEGEAVPDLDTLAQLLFFSAGVTRSRKHPQGETFFRAAACTGALYEIELYVVCTNLKSRDEAAGGAPSLPAGVYHFGAAEFGLRQLRAGDFRQAVVEAAGNDPSLAHAPVIILCTGTYWRNAWKYRSRTYRHFGWDNGTILANLLAMSAASKLPAKIIDAFIDEQVNTLLGLNAEREVAFSIVSVGHTGSTPAERTIRREDRASDRPVFRKGSGLSRDAQDAPGFGFAFRGGGNGLAWGNANSHASCAKGNDNSVEITRRIESSRRYD